MKTKYKNFRDYAKQHLKYSYVSELKEIIKQLPDVKEWLQDLFVFTFRVLIFIVYPIRLSLVFGLGYIQYRNREKDYKIRQQKLNYKIKNRNMSMKELKEVDPEQFDLENSYKTFEKDSK